MKRRTFISLIATSMLAASAALGGRPEPQYGQGTRPPAQGPDPRKPGAPRPGKPHPQPDPPEEDSPRWADLWFQTINNWFHTIFGS